eukprot:SAG11_NODE_23912_length_381_cov_0.914894_1_plen_86_part_00
MNILDLNDDIMSKVKHNIFLRNLMEHKEDNFNYEGIDWYRWETDNDFDFFPIENGAWAFTTPADCEYDKYDCNCLVFEAKYISFN